MKHLLVALTLISCQPVAAPSVMRCQNACVAPDVAFTAGHCVGQAYPYLALVERPGCATPTTRRPVDGETVTVGERATTVRAARWLTWTILEGRAERGESGSGVYGDDGALLAIVIETRDDLTYAWRLVP